jgi:hypothetical protein
MTMKKTLFGLAALALVALAVPTPASARASLFFGLPGFSVFAGPPVYAPPPPVYVAPPAYYAPPVYYGYGRRYPAYYYGRPYYRGYRGYYRGPGYYRHGRW